MTRKSTKTTWSKQSQKRHRRMLVEALRSGEYKQTKGTLRRGNSFCCLGVACDISGLGEWEKDEGSLYQFRPVDGTRPVDGLLPEIVRSWLGFSTSAGDLDFVGADNHLHVTALSHLNDNGKRFTTIAKIIESEPEGLVK